MKWLEFTRAVAHAALLRGALAAVLACAPAWTPSAAHAEVPGGAQRQAPAVSAERSRAETVVQTREPERASEVSAVVAAPVRGGEVPVLPLADAAARLRSGAWLLLMRHATTESGVGDPPGLRIGDCSTQRNLSEAGRAQAARVGHALRAAGVRPKSVLASQWCRCKDTADAAFGRHEEWSALNSFFNARDREARQNRQIAEYAASLRAPAIAMLVTHQVNVAAATGVYPGPAEIVAARWVRGRLDAAFRFRADGGH